MTIVTVSPKFQIVIPHEVRKNFPIHPGEKLQVVFYENRIQLIPIPKFKQMRGILKGANPEIEREKDRI